jgi:hypothetical protein
VAPPHDRQPIVWTDRLDALHDEAMRRFGARCLWNARPSKSPDGMTVIAALWRRDGGMDAWRLAASIRVEPMRAAG